MGFFSEPLNDLRLDSDSWPKTRDLTRTSDSTQTRDQRLETWLGLQVKDFRLDSDSKFKTCEHLCQGVLPDQIKLKCQSNLYYKITDINCTVWCQNGLWGTAAHAYVPSDAVQRAASSHSTSPTAYMSILRKASRWKLMAPSNTSGAM